MKINNQQPSTQYLPPSFRKRAACPPPPRPPGTGKGGPDSAFPLLLLLTRAPPPIGDQSHRNKTSAGLPAPPAWAINPHHQSEHRTGCISGKMFLNSSDFLFHHL